MNVSNVNVLEYVCMYVYILHVTLRLRYVALQSVRRLSASHALFDSALDFCARVCVCLPFQQPLLSPAMLRTKRERERECERAEFNYRSSVYAMAPLYLLSLFTIVPVSLLKKKKKKAKQARRSLCVCLCVCFCRVDGCRMLEVKSGRQERRGRENEQEDDDDDDDVDIDDSLVRKCANAPKKKMNHNEIDPSTSSHARCTPISSVTAAAAAQATEQSKGDGNRGRRWMLFFSLSLSLFSRGRKREITAKP